MTTHSSNNERIKRRYFSYLKEAKRQSEQTVDAVAKALNRFEVHSKYRDFKAFHYEQAIAFKKQLAEQRNQKTGLKLSKATLHSTLALLKNFFRWLSEQPGYKSRLQYCNADYFNLSEKELRVATARREQKAPTLEQIKHVIIMMPLDSEIDRRNQAIIAFTILTGARDSAIASIKLKHLDLSAGSVHQDAREVKTKFSKSFTTFFFPVGNEILEILADWVSYLREGKHWGNDDPVFPATKVGLGAKHQFEVVGLKRNHWSNATPIRKIFRDAFEGAGLPYFNPHSFRNTLVRLGESICQTPEEFKAWSQNLGHEKVLTTFYSYGEVGNRRQGEIIKGLTQPQSNVTPDVAQLAKALAHELRQPELPG
jgi:integrase|tara:strand:+ start:2129 stop:3232 length:1104 start_codon:yes stop_codon:yes gene_type:complete